MVIYGEILFLENALTGGLLLWMTGRLSRCPLRFGRQLCFGAALCGLYAFTVFLESSLLSALASKLLFSAALMVLVFGRADRRSFALRLLIFYVTSFLMGGITMGLAGLTATPAASANGSFYLDHLTFVHIFAGCGFTALAVELLLSYIRDGRYRTATGGLVTVIYKERRWTAQGFFDTGNLLNDPLSGCPVCLIRKSLARQLLELHSDQTDWISYRGAGGEEGILQVIRGCELEFSAEEMPGTDNFVRRCAVTLAIVESGDGWPWGRGVEILLHGWLMDEGYEGYVKLGKDDEIAS